MVCPLCILFGLQLAHGNRQPLSRPVSRRQCLHTCKETPQAISVQRSAALFQRAPQGSLLSEHCGLRDCVLALLHHELDQLLAVDLTHLDGRAHAERLCDEAQVSAQVQKGDLSLAQPAISFFYAFVHHAQGTLRVSMVTALGAI